MSTEVNPRVEMLRKMIGTDPDFWPFPIPKFLKMQLLEVEEGFVKAKFVVQKEWLNPLNIMHGGILATLMDELMGVGSYTLNRPNGHASINMNIDFLYGAKEGDVLIAEGILLRKGKKIVHAEAKVWNEAGTLIAKSSSNLAVVG
jgi:uncharacterized protein (TIGR00369 family)